LLNFTGAANVHHLEIKWFSLHHKLFLKFFNENLLYTL